MGPKKCLLCFETHVFHSHELLSTRRWAIDSDGVVRLVEISPVVKVVLLAMCFLVFALCLVGCNSRWDLSLSDHDPVLFGTCNQVQLSIYRFTFQVFSPKWFSAFNSIKLCGDFPLNRSGIYCCVTYGCGSKDIRELKNHDDGLVDDDRKWVTLYCASATSKFRRRGVVDDAKQSRITSSCNPQASAGINPLF